jgi:hypothetical protein
MMDVVVFLGMRRGGFVVLGADHWSSPLYRQHPIITPHTKTRRICADLEIVFFGPPGGTHTQPTPGGRSATPVGELGKPKRTSAEVVETVTLTRFKNRATASDTATPSRERLQAK